MGAKIPQRSSSRCGCVLRFPRSESYSKTAHRTRGACPSAMLCALIQLADGSPVDHWFRSCWIFPLLYRKKHRESMLFSMIFRAPESSQREARQLPCEAAAFGLRYVRKYVGREWAFTRTGRCAIIGRVLPVFFAAKRKITRLQPPVAEVPGRLSGMQRQFRLNLDYPNGARPGGNENTRRKQS